MKSSLGASSTLFYFNNLQDASADLDVVVYTKRTILILLFAHQKTPLVSIENFYKLFILLYLSCIFSWLQSGFGYSLHYD